MAAADTIDVEVASVHREAEDILSIELVSVDRSPLPEFEAGSHVDLYLGDDLVRPYSLCSDPHDASAYRLGVLLEPESRGGSAAVHREMRPGLILRLGRPRNNFQLVEAADRSVLIAGGIGITPMLAMAYRLSRLGRDFELHYCARSRSRAAFLDLIGRSAFADRLVLHLDDGAETQRLSLDHVLANPNARTHLYVCGPTGLIDFVRGGAHARGWTDDTIHSEYFTAEIDTGGDTFTVVARRSGKSTIVAEDETIIEALARVGVHIDTSCEQGVCGTCLTPVLAGEPDHRDLFQSDDEKTANSHVIPCCSRSKSPELILDI